MMVESGIRVVIGVVYAIVYLGLTLITVGMGHGTLLLATGLISLGMLVFSLALFSWMDAAGPRLQFLDRQAIKPAILVLMLVGYVSHLGFFLLFELGDAFRYTTDYFRLEPMVMTVAIAWWILGQVGFWLIYFNSRANG